MHSPERDAGVDAGLRRWLNESAEHRAAFDRANELWETASRVPAAMVPRPAPPARPASSSIFVKAAFALSLLAFIGTLILFTLQDTGLSTAVGEQRMLTLEDGTRVSMNTATRLVIDYDRNVRRVKLTAGEALFEVAKRPDWPFVVIAGDRTISALGTAFVVRRDAGKPGDLAVTLVEGKIAIDAARVAPGQPPALQVATPGQRVTYAPGTDARVDHPNVEHLTAWRRGQVVLESTLLSDAIAEMNRYSAIELTLDNAAAGKMRVSGIFRAGDSDLFARAIAETYHLEVIEKDGVLRLTGTPSL